MTTKNPTNPFHFPTEAPELSDSPRLSEKVLQKQLPDYDPINEHKCLPKNRAAMNKLLSSWLVCTVD